MINIKSIEVNGRFKYLWLKYVTGVNLSVHCARCLNGSYSKKISPAIKKENNILLNEHEAIVYYLCGVSSPYKWANNFHLAFKEKEGSTITLSRNGIVIVIENAEEIKFSINDINKSDIHINNAAYSTCRNWQFAHHLIKNNLI